MDGMTKCISTSAGNTSDIVKSANNRNAGTTTANAVDINRAKE